MSDAVTLLHTIITGLCIIILSLSVLFIVDPCLRFTFYIYAKEFKNLCFFCTFPLQLDIFLYINLGQSLSALQLQAI